MSDTLEIPKHIRELMTMMEILATTLILRGFTTAQEYQDISFLHNRFSTYTQKQLDEDLVNYVSLAKRCRGLRRLVIWRLSSDPGFTQSRVAVLFKISRARVKAICDREERTARRVR